MEKKKYNWGIIGPGKIACKFAEDLAMVPNAKLYAVASRSNERAQEFAHRFNVEVIYSSYEVLAQDKKVDIIYVATPHVYHHAHTLLCLKNKKAVLCEKPFAMDRKQVEDMIRTAKAEEVFLMEALWTYFLPHYRYILSIVEQETYGKLKSMKADFGFAAPFLPEKRLYNKKLGGGSLLDIGIYPVFAALTLLGTPDHINAEASLCDTGVDESCNIQLTYKNGAVAELSSAINKILPTTAILVFENATVTLIDRFHEPTSILIELKTGKKEEITFDVNTRGYNYEAEHVQEMLNQNRTQSTIMTFEKSLALITILDEIREKIGLFYSKALK